jgi:hypothetical protein
MILRKEGICCTRLTPEATEMTYEESDPFIVPKKPVMTVEGRDGHTN